MQKLRHVASNNRCMKRLKKETASASSDAASKFPFRKIDQNILFQCFLARAVSESHWVEQWATVSPSHFCFYHPDKKRPTYRVCLKSILNLKCVQKENNDIDSPNISQLYFSTLETLGRTIYCLHASAAQRNDWIASMSKAITLFRGYIDLHDKPEPIWETITHAPDDPAQEYLHCSSIWSCKGRRILNCKKFLFNENKQLEKHPCDVVEEVLGKALKLNSDSKHKALCSFLDSSAYLKAVDLSVLSEYERKVFFINLYHTMVMHALFVVLGYPTFSFDWISYFNIISYQCSDDIFSLAELEHRIIRAGMSPPSKFIAKFVLPKTEYRFALSMADFRLIFALNCGSFSNRN